jgi:acetyl-CoA/propionyl-CoA carboxylase, biotin carboxylase, biotin carboxyl carrier protein
VMRHGAFVAGEYDTRFLERHPEVLEVPGSQESHNGDGASPEPAETEQLWIEVNGRRFDVRIRRQATGVPQRPPTLSRARSESVIAREGSETIISPIQGTVLSVAVEPGMQVRAGDVVCVIEAMKMENEISAGRDGVVSRLDVTTGETVQAGAVVAVISSDDAGGASID